MGDEQSFADPTVNALCARVAELLGFEAAVFLPSGTMCNEIAFRLHIRPGGDEALLHRTSHPLVAEAGGPAAFSGAMMCPLDGERGMFDAATLQRGAAPARRPLPAALAARLDRADRRTSPAAACGRSSGCARWSTAARDGGLRLHLDGARLMNAVVASGVPAARVDARLRHRVDRLQQGPRRPDGRGAGRLARADRRGVALQADAGRRAAPGGHRRRGRAARARPPRRPPGRRPRQRARARGRAGGDAGRGDRPGRGRDQHRRLPRAGRAGAVRARCRAAGVRMGAARRAAACARSPTSTSTARAWRRRSPRCARCVSAAAAPRPSARCRARGAPRGGAASPAGRSARAPRPRARPERRGSAGRGRPRAAAAGARAGRRAGRCSSPASTSQGWMCCSWKQTSKPPGGGPRQLQRRGPERPPLAGAAEQAPAELAVALGLRARCAHADAAGDHRGLERGRARARRSGAPLSVAGSPRAAANSSPRTRVEHHARDRAPRRPRRRCSRTTAGCRAGSSRCRRAGRRPSAARWCPGRLATASSPSRPSCGRRAASTRADRRLGRAVGRRDEVGRPVLGRHALGRAAIALQQLVAGAASRLGGDLEQLRRWRGHDPTIPGDPANSPSPFTGP